MPATRRTDGLGLPDAAMRLARFGLSYHATWQCLLDGRLRGRRHGRQWRVDAESLASLERQLEQGAGA